MNDQSVKITCPSCKTVFSLAPGKINAGGIITRCSVCGNRFAVRSSKPVKHDPDALVTESTPEENPYDAELGPVEDEAGEGLSFGEDDTDYDDLASETAEGAEDEELDLESEDSDEEPEQEEEKTRDSGVVEFFIEGDDGSIDRVETHKAEGEVPPTDTEDGGKKVSVPDDDLIVHDDNPSLSTSKRQAMKAPARRSPFAREDEAPPVKGLLYNVMLIIIGACGLGTNFLSVGAWKFDPFWSGTLIVLGLAGFLMQNLAGVYISGFFTFSFAFAMFSSQKEALENSQINGVLHLAVIFAVGILFLTVYYLLMNRRRGHFRLQEGIAQSLCALLFGCVSLVLAVWAHIDSPSIPPLGEFLLMGAPIGSIYYYITVSLTVIIQSWMAALAISLGLSAMRVRNRLLLFAGLGLSIGLLVLLMQFAHLVLERIVIPFPG